MGGRKVLDGVDLDVAPGEVVGLLGPNGAGKSTCFKLIAGLDSADAGQVWLDEQPLDGLPLWRRVTRGLGYLAQEPSVFRGLSVRENLLVPLERRGEAEQADALLEEAGLSHLSASLAGALSGGERRRLEIARALASRRRSRRIPTRAPAISARAFGSSRRQRRVDPHDRGPDGLGINIAVATLGRTLPECV